MVREGPAYQLEVEVNDKIAKLVSSFQYTNICYSKDESSQNELESKF